MGVFEVALMWFKGGYVCGNVVLPAFACGNLFLDYLKVVIRWRESH